MLDNLDIQYIARLKPVAVRMDGAWFRAGYVYGASLVAVDIIGHIDGTCQKAVGKDRYIDILEILDYRHIQDSVTYISQWGDLCLMAPSVRVSHSNHDSIMFMD